MTFSIFHEAHSGNWCWNAISAMLFTLVTSTAVYCSTVGLIYIRTDCFRDLTWIHYSLWLVVFGIFTLLLTEWLPYSVLCDPDRADDYVKWILSGWFYVTWGVIGALTLRDDRSPKRFHSVSKVPNVYKITGNKSDALYLIWHFC
jgi:hypothetical protein